MDSESFGNIIKVNASLSQSGAISIFVEILENYNHPIVFVKLFIDSGTGWYDFEVMNRTVDVCQFFRNKRYEPLLQIFYKVLLESGPFPKACPIRKVFGIKNVL